MSATLIKFPHQRRLNHEQFEQLALANQHLKLELTPTGDLVIMPPTGGTTGRRNADLIYQLQAWNRQSNLGVVFDSSTIFRLPNGAERSPDVAWIELSRWRSLSPAEQDNFPPLCPDFIIELRSKSDSLKELQQKMQEYQDCGCRLGWLINPQNRQVEIYRPHQKLEILDNPAQIIADILPNFCLDLSFIW